MPAYSGLCCVCHGTRVRMYPWSQRVAERCVDGVNPHVPGPVPAARAQLGERMSEERYMDVC